jgi:hypothetical protein
MAPGFTTGRRNQISPMLLIPKLDNMTQVHSVHTWPWRVAWAIRFEALIAQLLSYCPIRPANLACRRRCHLQNQPDANTDLLRLGIPSISAPLFTCSCSYVYHDRRCGALAITSLPCSSVLYAHYLLTLCTLSTVNVLCEGGCGVTPYCTANPSGRETMQRKILYATQHR